ncbi:MAG: hypothetical protein DMF56_21465 [Acidobacteria bacterium]|nr:MAG: hypothetical protein DMF56_21465 [Acidobacteriota bacterium]
MSRRAVATLLLMLFSMPLAADPPVQGGAIPLPLPLFPPNNWWNTDVSNAPTDSNADGFLTYIGKTKGMHPDFGGDAGGGNVYGFPFIVVDGNQPKLTVTFVDFSDQSDGVDHTTATSFPFYPVPPECITQNGWVEGGQPGTVDQRGDEDRHVLMVDKTNNTLYELYNVWYNGTGWEAASGAFFDMKTNNRRPDTWTSADAAGLAILPGLVRYDEVAGPDEIRHAFRFTVRSTNGYVYPASHEAGSTSGAPPMGLRLRLKSTTNISGFPADVQKIFRAMKKYGLIVADNGTDMYVSGTYDTRWNNDVLNPAFSALKVSDFEVIERGWKPSVSLVITFPAGAGANEPATATVTAYDPNDNVATSYTGTIHFTATNASTVLPADYTFTPADAGTHTFTNAFTFPSAGNHVVTATDTLQPTITGSRGVIVGPATPTGFFATATSTSQISLSWNAVAGATQYEIQRSSASNSYATLITTAATTFNDNTVAGGSAYVYKVRALDAASRPSPFSAPDPAIAMLFTDDPLMSGVTPMKAVHLAELRQAVNALRAVAALGNVSFTDAASAGVPVKAIHIQELRDALTPARAALGLGMLSFTNPTLTPGTTAIRAVHLQEVRAGVK